MGLVCWPAVALALGLVLATPMRAEDEPATERVAQDAQAALEARRQSVNQEIANLRAEGEAGSVDRSQEIQALEALIRTYERHAEVLGQTRNLDRRMTASEQRLADGPKGQLAQAPPYVLAVLDALADARDGQHKQTQTLERAAQAAQEALDAALKNFERAERERRKAADAAEDAKDVAERARRNVSLQQARLASREAEAERDLARAEVDAFRLELEVQRRDEQLLSDTVAWVRQNLSFEPADQARETSELEDRTFEARRARERAERQLVGAEGRLADAERRLEASPEDGVRLAELELQRAEVQRWQLLVSSAAQAIDDWQALETVNERRVHVLTGDVARPDLLDWQTELEARRDEVRRNLRLLEARRGEFAEERDRIARRAPSAPPAERRALTRQTEAVDAIVTQLDADRARWVRIAGSADRVLAEMAERAQRVSFGERLSDLARRGGEVWESELFVVDDRPITVGKLTTALLLFVVGFFVARVVSRVLGRLLLRRVGIEQGASTAIASLAFYALLLFFFLSALRTVNIPLTVFTVLGGALAIGVGFGSQNIVNNFISGLILLAERPIKVGDIIEVEGTKGQVEGIGPRSTRVRTFDNIHMIIPNSAFLEKSVVNWTLADDDIRTHVDVGVAYGSATRDVQRFLARAIADHGRILKKPDPMILFTGFGDDALLFRAYFWIRSRDMAERLTIESDVRYRIDHLFREASISIAFPQRDVHLDALHPLDVRLVEPTPSTPTSDET
jgi:small-conductance mechanosensitive channel